MPPSTIQMAKEVDRVPSSMVPLDAQEERRFEQLMDEIITVVVHQHPLVLPEVMEELTA